MRLGILGLSVVFGISVSACSGGSGTSSLPNGPRGAAPNPGSPNVTMKLVIANTSAAANAKRPNFVSPSTNGVKVVTYAHSDTNHTTPLGTTVTDVSGGSSACVTTGGNRSCTVPITAPAGTDDFVFTLYDTAPSGGLIPSSAHVLGTAGVTQTIAANTTNSVNAGIGGVIAGLSGQAASVNITSQAANIGLTITPTDFGNQQIIAGTTNSAFANPITVALTESGGSGHASLQLNGGTSASSVIVQKATDTVQVVYDGLAALGYSIGVSLSTSANNGIAGATENATITPVLFVTNLTTFFTVSSGTLNTYPEGQHVLLISEPSGTPTFTATPTGCSGILRKGTIVPTIGSPAKATLLVVGGTTISASGCSLAISDGTVTYTVAVTNALRSDSATHTITEYATTAINPFGIATGADGNLWFSENNSGSPAISTITSNGTGYTKHLMLAGAGWVSPFGVALGADGNIWVGDDNSSPGNLGKVTTGGTITTYHAGHVFTNFMAPGLDGLAWFSECSSDDLSSVTTSGTVTQLSPSGGGQIQGMALGPDGNIWFTDIDTQKIGTIVNGIPSLISSPLTKEPSTAEDIVAGSDGSLWISEGNLIAQVTTSGIIINEYGGGSAIGSANFITAGPDGALWFTDTSTNAIGRITTSGTITEYTLPTGSATPNGITVGPDGNLWFVEGSVHKVGVLKL